MEVGKPSKWQVSSLPMQVRCGAESLPEGKQRRKIETGQKCSSVTMERRKLRVVSRALNAPIPLGPRYPSGRVRGARHDHAIGCSDSC